MIRVYLLLFLCLVSHLYGGEVILKKEKIKTTKIAAEHLRNISAANNIKPETVVLYVFQSQVDHSLWYSGEYYIKINSDRGDVRVKGDLVFIEETKKLLKALALITELDYFKFRLYGESSQFPWIDKELRKTGLKLNIDRFQKVPKGKSK